MWLLPSQAEKLPARSPAPDSLPLVQRQLLEQGPEVSKLQTRRMDCRQMLSGC